MIIQIQNIFSKPPKANLTKEKQPRAQHEYFTWPPSNAFQTKMGFSKVWIFIIKLDIFSEPKTASF